MSLNTENAILSNAIKVDSSYNVGIGGIAGPYKLDVFGTSRFGGTLTMDGSGGTANPITLIYNTSNNRLLTPLVRLYGATNIGSNYVELFGTNATSNRTINFPDASGTVALTSNLSAYLPLSGGTLTGALNGTSSVFSSTISGAQLIATGTSIQTISNAVIINNSGASVSRFYSFGNDSATLGGFKFIGIHSDQGAPTTFLDIAVNTGNATFSGSVYAVNDRNYFQRAGFRLTSASNNASTLDITVNDTTTFIYSNYYSGGNDNAIIIGTYAANSNQLVLKNTGNVLIGTTTDAGQKFQVAGDIRATGTTQAPNFVSATGTAACPYASYATFFTCQNYQNAIYLVTLQLNGYTTYTAYATIVQNDSTLTIMNQVNNNAGIQVSGLNIQGTNGSGITQSMVYKIIKIS